VKQGGKKLRYDLLLIAALLIVALLLYLLLAADKTGGDSAVVCVQGVETERFSLSEDGRYELNGGSNILIIQGGEAWLEDANCPDKLCVRQGKVRYDGQCITCLPNKLTVTISSGNAPVDLIS